MKTIYNYIPLPNYICVSEGYDVSIEEEDIPKLKKWLIEYELNER